MAKEQQYNPHSSPFGPGVSQFPNNDDPTVERAPAESPVEELPQGGSEVSVPSRDTDLSTRSAGPPLLIDFLTRETILGMTPEQKAGVTQRGNLSEWMTRVMVCKDHSCKYKEKCLLFRLKLPRPVGKDCVIEEHFIANAKWALMEHLGDEYKGDPWIELRIDEVILNMVQENRAAQQHAIDGGIIEVDDIKGFDRASGEKIIGKVLHRALNVLNQTGKRKDRLLADLLATPRERAKVDRDGMYDRSRKAAEIGDRMAKIAEKRKKDMKREVYVVERVEMEDGSAEITPHQVIDIKPEE
jgi:hypothetical protein